jgi:urease accessory protein
MRIAALGVILVAVFTSPAFAHPGLEHARSFADGLLHPLTGADHILTMMSVGLWATIVGGRAIWIWPAAFMAVMLAGFAAALLGLQISFAESAIAASIVVLGLLVVTRARVPVMLGTAIVGSFGFFHGYTHGTEAAGISLIPYAAGFTVSTAMLHAAGIGLGVCLRSLVGHDALALTRQMWSAVPHDGGR